MAIYSQILQEYLKTPDLIKSSFGRFLLFLPLLFWFWTVFCTVIGIYPKTYVARTPMEKEAVMIEVGLRKRFWMSLSLSLFLLGFVVFVYVIGAQIWAVYPFV